MRCSERDRHAVGPSRASHLRSIGGLGLAGAIGVVRRPRFSVSCRWDDECPRRDKTANCDRTEWIAVLKRRLNQLLTAATGYQLQRVTNGAGTSTSQASGRARQSADREKPQGSDRRQVARGKAGSLPAYYDDAAKRTIRRVKQRTMTGNEKLFGLILATRYIAEHRIPGDIVECGVWRGWEHAGGCTHTPRGR